MELLHLMVAHSYRIDYMFRSCQISEIRKPTGGYKTRFAVFDDEGQQSSEEEEEEKKEGKEED
jgi:hypothetical protein